MLKRSILFASVLASFFAACTEETPVPKPRAYPKVVYPAKEYVAFTENYCDFSFDLPKYAVIERDTTFFDERAPSDCWFNILVPQLNAKIYCSYYPIQNQKGFEKLVGDAFELTNKHTIKADYINEIPVSRPKDRVYGMLFNVEGPAASSWQFFLTDSTRHFVRGALYFGAQARPDSLAPVVAFMRADVERLVSSLQWR